MLRYGFSAGRNKSLMVFHGLLTKGRPLEARHETQDLNGGFDKKTFMVSPARPYKSN